MQVSKQIKPKLDVYQSHSGIFTTDISGKIIYWSKASEKLLGYSSNEVINKICYSILCNTKFNKICRENCYPVNNSLRNRSTKSFDIFWNTKNEGMRRFKVTILYSDKKNKEIVHIFHDIKKTDGIEKLTKMICNSDIDLPTPELYEYLTPRENQSLKLLASGCTIKEIAEILEIKKFTARNYILNVMHKLNAKTQLQAVINAARLQIL